MIITIVFIVSNIFQNSADESAGEEDEEEKSARLHKIRVEAGKKAAATRKAKEQVSS